MPGCGAWGASQTKAEGLRPRLAPRRPCGLRVRAAPCGLNLCPGAESPGGGRPAPAWALARRVGASVVGCHITCWAAQRTWAFPGVESRGTLLSCLLCG